MVNLKSDILNLLENSFKEGEADYHFFTSIIHFVENYKNYALVNELEIKDEDFENVSNSIYSFLIERAKNEINILFNEKGSMNELDGIKVYLQNFIENDKYRVNIVKLIILKVISDACNDIMVNEKSKGCYIATMAYGDYNHPKVIILRQFRDDTLDKNILGKWLIKIYYYYSPKLVEKLKNKKNINIIIRKTLNQFIKLIKK